jgi:hypothetical protein
MVLLGELKVYPVFPSLEVSIQDIPGNILNK